MNNFMKNTIIAILAIIILFFTVVGISELFNLNPSPVSNGAEVLKIKKVVLDKKYNDKKKETIKYVEIEKMIYIVDTLEILIEKPIYIADSLYCMDSSALKELAKSKLLEPVYLAHIDSLDTLVYDYQELIKVDKKSSVKRTVKWSVGSLGVGVLIGWLVGK